MMNLMLEVRNYCCKFAEGEVMDNFITFFTSIFRSSRFGAASSHGKANMMRFKYFEEKIPMDY